MSEGLRVDLFKYLTDTRVRIGANAAALDARRDFYLAAADLQAALSIGGDSAGSCGADIVDAMTLESFFQKLPAFCWHLERDRPRPW